MKRLFALLIVCTIMLSLAACGGASAQVSQASAGAEPEASDVESGQELASEVADASEEASAPEDTDAAAAPEEPAAEATDVSVYPICESGEITLTWMEGMIPLSMNAMEPDNGQNVFFRELEKVTGIDFEFRHENTESFYAKFDLMLAAEDYPDIASAAPAACAESADAAYDTGIIVRLNDYEDLIPNYLAVLNGIEGGYRNTITDDGNLLCFGQIYDRLQPSFCGYQVRQNWLDDLGMELPETVDDWHDMLVRFKEEKTGGAAPMDLANTGLADMNWFASAYGVNITGATVDEKFHIQRDGVVACSVIEDGFRNYLETMSAWYDEGLINRDFISGTGFAGSGFAPDEARLAAGESGAFPAMYSMSGTFFADTNQAEPGTFTAMVAQPTLERGVPNKIGDHGKNASRIITAAGEIVFADCENVEAAISALDYMYSDAGSLLKNFGVEGETFTYGEDGKPVFTDLIVNNPNLDFAIARQVYLRNNGGIFLMDAEEQSISDPYCLTYYDVWNKIGEWNLDGNITYTVEESSTRAALMSDIQTYVAEFSAKVISGQTELNDTTWEAYLDTMDRMGINEVTPTIQSAYTRYLER